MKRGIVTLFFLLFFSTIAYSQKGSWQIQLEKKLQTAQSQEDRLVLQCAIGQEMKEYSLPKAWSLANEVLGKAKQLGLSKAQAEAYSLIAEILRLRSRPYEALAYHQKAYVIFEKEKQATALQRTKRDMAFATSNFSKFDSAQVILQEVVYWFEQHEPNTREHALSLYVLGINSIRLGKLQESLDYTVRAKKIFETLQDTYNQARSENNIGLIYKNMGYYKKGVEHYNKALEILEETSENQRATTTVLINMGNVYLSLHDTLYREHIFKYFERSHKISLYIQDTLQIISSIEALAKAEAFRKDFHKANTYYREGLRLIQRTQNDLEEGYFSLRLSEIYISAKDFKQAININEQALHIFEKRQAWSSMAQAYIRLARIYHNIKDYKTSQKYAYLTLESCQKSGDTSLLAHLYNLLLSNAILLQKFDEADKWGKIALKEYRQTNKSEFLLETYRNLIKADTIRKRPEAVHWFGLYNRLRDSLLSANRNKDLLEMQFKYDMQDQMRENKYLKEVNELNRVEARQQTIISISIGMMLLAVIFVASFLYYHRQRLQKLLRIVREKNRAIVEKNNEIEAQNENLATLNFTKDRILSIISHDMRNPLGNLKAILNLANDGYISLEEQVEMTQKLNKDIERVYEFLQHLLFWAESQMAGFVPSVEKFTLFDNITHIFSMLERQASLKSIDLQNKVLPALTLETDKDIVNIILLNLVSNALKFTPNAGKIEISASQENGFIKIAVQDNGVGIAPENTENIFGKSRFTTEGTQKEKGTGFGLTLCRDFVQILGGKIYFESVLREGTTFFVEIPSKNNSEER